MKRYCLKHPDQEEVFLDMFSRLFHPCLLLNQIVLKQAVFLLQAETIPWQKLEKIRILVGDEVSKRTKKALLAGVETAKQILDSSIDKEKEKKDFLSGVPAIVEAIRKNQIECRIYTKDKFHAKAYITHAKHAVIGATALVGSSNFTYPGLTENVELNIQIRREVDLLQEWYERHWKEAEPISEEILKVIERHTREYSPFEVYAKALQEYFRR